MTLRAKLLRLVPERTFVRVGGERPLEFKARVVCATNTDLDRAVRDGRFRQDLYYRLNVIPVRIPPLRERKEDILPLAHMFIAEFAESFGSQTRRLTTVAEETLVDHAWPGNVRELRNRVERGVALAEGAGLGASDLFPERATSDSGEPLGSLAKAREAAERRQILAALEQTDGQVRLAAERLGVSRSTLSDKIKKLGLQRHAREDAR
jgi:DNA-binding NtrC family response regulator